MGTTYKVIVADDEKLFLNNIVRNIQAVNLGFEVAGTAQDGKEALGLIEKLSPDVLVTDIKMPVMDGLELVKTVAFKYPDIVKIVISGYDDFKYAQHSLIYEVKDYLLKPLRLEDVAETFRRVKIYLDAQNSILRQNILQPEDNHTFTTEEISRMLKLYIKENYTQDINFDSIAKNFHFNSSYLCKIFTKYTGENPSKYLIELRINKAKQLLLQNKELLVREIGEMVGYPNQFYFSRIFKVFTGKSPADYREESHG
jgi:two-component system, response regulator YesN